MRIWCAALLACIAATYAAFRYVDMALAGQLRMSEQHAETAANFLAGSVLIGGEAAVIVALVVVRLTRGRLPPFWQTLALACAASIAAYLINASVLKVIFGVVAPKQLAHGASHAVHWLAGSDESSFPSGHMMLASAFAGVFMRAYRRSIVPLAAMLAAAGVLLLLGRWHFLSDVIVGTFIGLSAGLVVGNQFLRRTALAS